jgi:GT2 family glycosyltransferase
MGKCLESVSKQSIGSLTLDHIVWDDGSSDLTLLEELKEKHPEVSFYLGNENVGLAQARNQAVAKSDADAFIFLDADDYINSNFIRDTVAASKGTKSPVYPSVKFFGRMNHHAQKPEWSKKDAMEKLFIPATSLVTREAFEACGGFTPGLPLFEDFDMWFRLARLGFEGKACNSAILYYNIREDSMSDHFNTEGRDLLKRQVYDRIISQ